MITKYIVNNLSGQTINGEAILNPYKVYTATITYNVDGWISTNILQNTLGGNLTFELTSVQSEFSVTATSLFTTNKTFVLMDGPVNGIYYSTGVACKIISENELTISFDGGNGLMLGEEPVTGFIEVRVYN